MKNPSIKYGGETFHIQSSGRYFCSGNKTANERLLHRRIWTDHFGPIPDGYEVHHVNEDWTDNRIDNLECLLAADHQRQHMLEKFKDPEFRAARLKDLEAAQIAAKAWHASPEGIEWHAAHGKKTWENRATTKVICSVCSSEYETVFPTRSRFCSLSCEQKECFQRHKTAVGACVLCGAAFTFNKYRKQECCSRDCGNKLRGLQRRGLWPIATNEKGDTS